MSNSVYAKINDIPLAGVTFEGRQAKLAALSSHQNGAYLTLRREPSNPYDSNAIQVLAHITTKDGTPSVFAIGYVPKAKAVWMAPALDAGRHIRVTGFKLIGGYDNKAFGCRMDIIHELATPAVNVTMQAYNKENK